MNKIKEDYVSLQLAKLLKEKGFDEICEKQYTKIDPTRYIPEDRYIVRLDDEVYDLEASMWNNSRFEEWNETYGTVNYSAPTHQMTLKWLREVHNILVIIYKNGNNFSWRLEDNKTGEILFTNDYNCICYLSYEDICEDAIKYVLDNFLNREEQNQQINNETFNKKLNRIYQIISLAADSQAYGTNKTLIGDKECIELQNFFKNN